MSLASVAELQALIHRLTGEERRLPATEYVPVAQAVGRVLAEDAVSALSIPPANVSAMDGYALAEEAKADTVLKVVGESAAGHPFSGQVPQNGCVRIMTGAVVPDDCCTVVMQENTRPGGQNEIVLIQAAKSGEHIRYAGEEVTKEQTVLQAGRRLRDADVLLLATLGFGEVAVYRKLRVAVLSTGDELVEPGKSVGEGQIYDSNRYMLAARLGSLPVELVSSCHVADDLAAISEALQQAAATADVVLTSGGVSVGDYDYLREAVDRIGTIHHYKVAMKPGKPFVFGRLGEAWYFGLPGNPVSSFVGFDMFVKTALWQLCGVAELPLPLRLQAVLSEPVRKAPGRMDIQRAFISQASDGTWKAAPCGSQDSHRIFGISQANAYLILPAESGSLPVGASVWAQPFEHAFL